MQTSITIKSYQEVMLPVSSFKISLQVLCHSGKLHLLLVNCLYSECNTPKCIVRLLQVTVSGPKTSLRWFIKHCVMSGIIPGLSSKAQIQLFLLIPSWKGSFKQWTHWICWITATKHWSSLKATKTDYGQWDLPDLGHFAVCKFRVLWIIFWENPNRNGISKLNHYFLLLPGLHHSILIYWS